MPAVVNVGAPGSKAPKDHMDTKDLMAGPSVHTVNVLNSKAIPTLDIGLFWGIQ